MVRMNMAEIFPQTLPSPSASSSSRHSPGLLSGERKDCLDELAMGKEVEQGEFIPAAKLFDEIIPVAKDTMMNLTVATPTRPTKLWVSLKKTRQPQPKKVKTPEMTISSAGSVVLELAVLAKLCTDRRRLLVILLSSAQQQLCETYYVTSHYQNGIECGHGRDCRDPDPLWIVKTVPSSQETTRTPPQPSNKLLRSLRQVPRVNESLGGGGGELGQDLGCCGAQAQDHGVPRIRVVSVTRYCPRAVFYIVFASV